MLVGGLQIQELDARPRRVRRLCTSVPAAGMSAAITNTPRGLRFCTRAMTLSSRPGARRRIRV
jgi:hypothetical protein